MNSNVMRAKTIHFSIFNLVKGGNNKGMKIPFSKLLAAALALAVSCGSVHCEAADKANKEKSEIEKPMQAQKISLSEAVRLIEVVEKNDKTQRKPAMPDYSTEQSKTYFEKEVPPEVWSKVHAQIFQNGRACYLVRHGKAYLLGAGTETVFAAGTAGPYSILVMDLNGDKIDDIVFLDKVVMSGVWYDTLCMFDGKTNMVAKAKPFMCKEIELTRNERNKLTAKVGNESFAVTFSSAEKNQAARLDLSKI